MCVCVYVMCVSVCVNLGQSHRFETRVSQIWLRSMDFSEHGSPKLNPPWDFSLWVTSLKILTLFKEPKD